MFIPVRTASILSKIVHSSEYIAYAEIILPTDDIFIGDTQLAVMGDISITFRNPDIIQY